MQTVCSFLINCLRQVLQVLFIETSMTNLSFHLGNYHNSTKTVCFLSTDI